MRGGSASAGDSTATLPLRVNGSVVNVRTPPGSGPGLRLNGVYNLHFANAAVRGVPSSVSTRSIPSDAVGFAAKEIENFDNAGCSVQRIRYSGTGAANVSGSVRYAIVICEARYHATVLDKPSSKLTVG
jgi:hypothetical protein